MWARDAPAPQGDRGQPRCAEQQVPGVAEVGLVLPHSGFPPPWTESNQVFLFPPDNGDISGAVVAPQDRPSYDLLAWTDKAWDS